MIPIYFVLSALCIIVATARPNKGFGPEGELLNQMLLGSKKQFLTGAFHHMPPFVASASNEAKEELKKIWSDATLTKEQLNTKLEQWAKNQGSDIQAKYNEFKQHLTQMQQQVSQRIQNSSLSANLKNIAQQIANVHSDMSLTVKASEEKVKQLMQSISEAEKRQIFETLRPMKPQQQKAKRDADDAAEAMKIDIMHHLLSHLTDEQRAALEDIVADKSQTKRQLIAKISEWATKEGPEAKQTYDATVKKIEEIKAKVKSGLEESTLNANGKDALNQLLNVFENQDLTLAQDATERNAILAKLSEEDKKEILAFLKKTISI
uniref:DUF148 domain-containing protein n=1 Tax=Syphacia muris TaxID=451379 RepID=A0A0N5AFA0_9BILA